MLIFVPKEKDSNETRTALTPPIVAKYIKLGAEVFFESGIGEGSRLTDQMYLDAGAKLANDRKKALNDADIVLRVNEPPKNEISQMKKGAFLVCHLDPFFNEDLVKKIVSSSVAAISMEMIPRSTIAQKMDSLSSQANIAGYYAVVLAAERIDKIMPMMTTPSGTLQPAKVFIIGAGVAGLQAIATARRLGARVEAFDTRPVVAEQVRSLGAKFVEINLGETGQTKDGYAKTLTDEQIAMQRKAMKAICAESDIVITTAKLFGRKPPTIITKDMVDAMKPGSVVVDLAVDASGGNCEYSKLNEEVDVNGVRVIGLGNLPGKVASSASLMYSNNLYNFIAHFWDKTAKTFKPDFEDEIIRSALIAFDGEIWNNSLRKAYGLNEIKPLTNKDIVEEQAVPAVEAAPDASAEQPKESAEQPKAASEPAPEPSGDDEKKKKGGKKKSDE
ncbi:MAG: Re/Si-specific NAD(P)(+) transhydrogenase subunit alpha [Planctomycetota bacterium]